MVLGLAGASLPAGAEDDEAPPPYRDDRSTAQALVHSLYNAISRKEYVRAWDYFSTPPASTFEAYAKGFAETGRVYVLTGRPTIEGAAGSTYYEVPVAISAHDTKGESKVFGGCYTVRQVNAQIQDPPFRSMLIEKGSLKASKESWLSNAIPDFCGDRKPDEETAEELTERVKAVFAADHERDCNVVLETDHAIGSREPEIYPLTFRYDSDEASAPARQHKLYEFHCQTYAYNYSNAYYLVNEYGEIEPVSFAEPRIEDTYGDDESRVLKSWKVDGLRSSVIIINPEFDEASATISNFAKFRGIGDAFSAGSWVFRQGAFILRNYDYDPTFNEAEDPVTVVKDGVVIPSGDGPPPAE
jgi:hypothetical protein